MRIALDGRGLTGPYTGDRTYWRNLLAALLALNTDDEYLVYTRLPIPACDTPGASNVRLRVLPGRNDRLWTLVTLPVALRRDGPDLLHVQYTVPVPALCPCPVVTTIHDISFRLFPDWYRLRDRVLLNVSTPYSMRASARVITVSESSRRDILRIYRLRPDRVVATPLGLPAEYADQATRTADGFVAGDDRTHAERVVARYGVSGPFVLSVGVLQPRKNQAVLAEAFGRAVAQYNLPHRLVLAGKAGWATDERNLRQRAARAGGSAAAAALDFPGYIPDADLPAFYRACDCFAFPSLYEGFGLPPLEAMACGAPVIASTAPAMPEVIGDAGLLVPPDDADAWAKALGNLLRNERMRSDLVARGLERVACFSWASTAALTREVYRKVVDAN